MKVYVNRWEDEILGVYTNRDSAVKALFEEFIEFDFDYRPEDIIEMEEEARFREKEGYSTVYYFDDASIEISTLDE